MLIQLSNIFDQEPAISVLASALRADRLPHGLIFAGPVGVGKATTARALGNVFLCEHPESKTDTAGHDWLAACGQCAACKLSSANSHPDYHVITKELIRYHDKTGKSKGIDLSIKVIVPELVAVANRKAAMGRAKVFVVEQAELMTGDAQNALLKTLEEPPGRTLIILLTHQASALLGTIRSRCQMIHFSPLSHQRICDELVAHGTEASVADVAAHLADGSLGLASRWLEQGVVTQGRQLEQMMGRLMDGLNHNVDLPAWFKSAAEAYAQKQLELDELASKDQAVREGLNLYLKLAGDAVRQRLRTSDDPDELEQSCAAIDALVRAEQYIDANVSIPLVFQQLQQHLAGVG